jgi:predicted small secreted protein
MKRSLIFALLLLTVFAAACATAPTKAADVSGIVSAVDGSTITVTPAAGGQPVTVTLVRSTTITWPTGVPAEHTDIVKGHAVNVWLADGTQTASRVNIGY